MTNSKKYCLITYTSSMTPFGANHLWYFTDQAFYYIDTLKCITYK